MFSVFVVCESKIFSGSFHGWSVLPHEIKKHTCMALIDNGAKCGIPCKIFGSNQKQKANIYAWENYLMINECLLEYIPNLDITRFYNNNNAKPLRPIDPDKFKA